MTRQKRLNDLRDVGNRLPQIIKRYLADLQQRSLADSAPYDDPPTFFFADSARIPHNPFVDTKDRVAPVVSPMKREG